MHRAKRVVFRSKSILLINTSKGPGVRRSVIRDVSEWEARHGFCRYEEEEALLEFKSHIETRLWNRGFLICDEKAASVTPGICGAPNIGADLSLPLPTPGFFKVPRVPRMTPAFWGANKLKPASCLADFTFDTPKAGGAARAVTRFGGLCGPH